MTNDKKLMLLAGVLALGMLAGCSSASAASAASGMAGSMPAASQEQEVSGVAKRVSLRRFIDIHSLHIRGVLQGKDIGTVLV